MNWQWEWAWEMLEVAWLAGVSWYLISTANRMRREKRDGSTKSL